MAVIFKDMTAEELFGLLGIGADETNFLKENAVVVTLPFGEILFQSAWNSGVAVAVQVKPSVLTKLKKGGLPQKDKTSLRTAVTHSIKMLMKLKDGSSTALDGPVNVAGHVVAKAEPIGSSAMALLQKKAAYGASDQAVPKIFGVDLAKMEGSVTWPVFDKAKLKSAEPIKLRDATMLYQPVRGSSPNSRYFLVAANKDLRIAARYKGNSLSVRIEGPAWEKYAEKISECGFDHVAVDKGYASLHLHVVNHVVASKALGAILMGIGIELQTPLPDMSVIKDVGS